MRPFNSAKVQRDRVSIGKVDETGYKNFAGEVIDPLKLSDLDQNVGRGEDLGVHPFACYMLKPSEPFRPEQAHHM